MTSDNRNKNPKMRRARNQEAVLLEEGRDSGFIKMSIASARSAMGEGGGELGGKGVASRCLCLSLTHSGDVLLCTNTAVTQRRESHEKAAEHRTSYRRLCHSTTRALYNRLWLGGVNHSGSEADAV